MSVFAEVNGQSRGDGHDFEVFRSRATGRFVALVFNVRRRSEAWFVAPTLKDALAVGQAGWTPGFAPGRFKRLARPDASREAQLSQSV